MRQAMEIVSFTYCFKWRLGSPFCTIGKTQTRTFEKTFLLCVLMAGSNSPLDSTLWMGSSIRPNLGLKHETSQG